MVDENNDQQEQALLLADAIAIYVGGKIFTTTRSTLCSDPNSMLAKLFDPDSPFKQFKADSVGRPFLDRNGDTFALVLDFLRRGQRLVGSSNWSEGTHALLLDDAEFYCLYGLSCAIQQSDWQQQTGNPVAYKAWIWKGQLSNFPVVVPYVNVSAPAGLPFEVHGAFRTRRCPHHACIMQHVGNKEHPTFEGFKIYITPAKELLLIVAQATSYYTSARSAQSGINDGAWHEFVCRITKDTISVVVDGIRGEPVSTSDRRGVQQEPKEFGRVVHKGPYVIGSEGVIHDGSGDRVFVGDLKNIALLDLSRPSSRG
jgi:hypothetical protein